MAAFLLAVLAGLLTVTAARTLFPRSDAAHLFLHALALLTLTGSAVCMGRPGHFRLPAHWQVALMAAAGLGSAAAAALFCTLISA